MTPAHPHPAIEELLDRAVIAINKGDRATADALAGQVLAVDETNLDAEELLASPPDGGEIRRLTLLFADLVDSTALSTRFEPEIYRTVVGRYRDVVTRLVNRYEGHLGSTKGDGLLAFFGHPTAHEDDARRAVQTGLDITREVEQLSRQVRRQFGVDIDVRVGIHRGLVYLDVDQDDVYGIGANLAARMCSLADPGSVTVSAAIERVVRDDYEFAERPGRSVKGVEGLQVHYSVIGERETAAMSHGPIVGRDAELVGLQKIWKDTAAGRSHPAGVVLCGEGGIGKTRLAGALVEAAEADGAAVIALFGSSFYTNVGLRPVRRFLELQCGISRGSDPADNLRQLDSELRRLNLDSEEMLPLLAPVLGLRPESGYRTARATAGRLYEQIIEAVTRYLLACLGSGPGVVLVEDFHWLDEDTREVVQALVRSHRGRMLVLVTDRQPTVLEGVAAYELKALNADQSDELICALHPEMRASARKAVRKRCDGIPLYIEEVVAKIREGTGNSEDSTLVPDTLYESLIARVRSARQSLVVVEAAALIGSRVERRLLASVVDLGQSEVDTILDDLTRARVLCRLDDESWRFHHELVREAATELAPPSAQHRLHSRIGDALVAAATDGTPEWSLVAHHYERAERFDDAAQCHQQASTTARQRGALSEARGHLSRALVNIERLPEGGLRDHLEISVRLEQGFLASAATGHASAEAAAEFERCLQLIGDQPSLELFATLSALWSYYATRGDLRRATQLVEALRVHRAEMPEWYLAANDAVVGALAVFRGEFDSARSTLEVAAAAVAEMASPQTEGAWYAPNDPVGGMYTFVAFVRYMQGDLAGAGEAFGQMERRCLALPFPHGPFTLCYGKTIEALIRSEAGQHDRAAALAAEVGELGRQNGFDEWVMISASASANTSARAVLAARGDDVDVRQAQIEALTMVTDAWRAADLKSFLCWYDAALAQALLTAGRKADAHARLDLALQMADETDWHIYDAELLRLRALTQDSAADRTTDLLASIEVAQKQGALTFELRSAAELFRADGDQHRADLVTLLKRFPADPDWPELVRVRALLA